MAPEVFLDASLFMGMHSTDPSLRAAATAFFAAHLERPVVMTYEEVGRCDDYVWRFPREVQDAYYPFMDVLHSLMPIRRRAYDADVLAALPGLPSQAEELRPRDRLLLASVVAAGGELVTLNPRLTALTGLGLPVRTPGPAADRGIFPADLDKLYEQSLVLEADHAEL
ncbi:DUF6190 family protein [Streptomyces sp. HU2014]|uniref:PIN domain-containing protein n=1 Tax=Streptomyces albireticuli TaxID=1940 RepID=A0A1Z2KW52_9ACTN|nr:MULTISPECIES: DUF6190 family protein [Streptomyces]ARZ66273.1 hypothetical protein SMD11_0607 [Streptomyces albireticuli]UQI46510.1 DUF6190 family protein [Streptomyces sp. HU2014]